MDTTIFQMRPFNVNTDFPRLVQLHADAEAVDHSGEDFSEEVLRDLLTAFGHDPRQDRRVVELTEEPGNIIAYSSLWKTPTNRHADITAVVHPAWRGHGIGSELMEYTLRRAREVRAESVLAYAPVKHLEANRFLQHRGFSPIAAYTAMLLAADVPMSEPVWPAGYMLRAYSDVRDFSTLLHAFNRCFEGQWGHHHLSEEELNEWFPAIDPQGILLLYAPDGQVAGMCRVEMSEQLSRKYGRPMGYLDAPGVVPEYRGKLLYVPLMQAGVQWLRAKGHVDIEFESWGDSKQTLTLYQERGFAIVRQDKIYRLVFD